ncbi:SCP2 sterol-binding domain-containing protein [Hazenella sp. IB182357]|uniref:SCP2 sterol-binding domain-containing protein n=1 Tax=Polycladospora coralii TaxID=2771432 RepID=A0A926NB41_9BACL|nr:SCP2 sterol-binding domain-containing protein [Polycladospora coralii]MBD1372897.1 SCP2 sterol-binding domain-containing protein [Polycladospora coralii]MBS7529409.1 SCP2 sterol-binding domain-containing protein [Polycladospora coralii]
MSVQTVISDLVTKVNANPEGIKNMNSTFQLDLTSGTYQVRFVDGKAEYIEGNEWDASCTMIMSDENFVKLVEGNLNPTTAFMMGKIKLQGELGQALKLQSVLKNYA